MSLLLGGEMEDTSLVVVDATVKQVIDGIAASQRPYHSMLSAGDYIFRRIMLSEGVRYFPLEITRGARVLYVESDKPITVYHEGSMDGHRVVFMLEIGDFEGGISIDADEGTTILVIVAKEEG